MRTVVQDVVEETRFTCRSLGKGSSAQSKQNEQNNPPNVVLRNRPHWASSGRLCAFGSWRLYLAAGQLLQYPDRPADVLVSVTLSDGGTEQLPRKRCQRSRDIVLCSRLQHQVHILLEPFHREIWLKVSLKDQRIFESHESGSRSAVVDDVQHQLRRHSRFCTQHEALVEGLEQVSQDHVLREFSLQSHVGSAAVVQQLAHRCKIWPQALEDCFLAPHHERQRRTFGTAFRSGARRIEEFDALCGSL